MNNYTGKELENDKSLEDIIKDIDFKDISFEGIQELEEIVTPGNGSVCCC